MVQTILRPNAAPLYSFLSLIAARRKDPGSALTGNILDCGAGGRVPPLLLFQMHGLEAWGIDISAQALEQAREAARQKGLQLHLEEADMRRIPYSEETFDYIYEHYSMCHLSKADTARAVYEMQRVLKPGGMGFLGVISTDTWPKSIFGEEERPGEYRGSEGERDRVLHSLFTDREADRLVEDWEVLWKSKQINYLHQAGDELTQEEWRELFCESGGDFTESEWEKLYESRRDCFQYVHLYFCLQKPED